MTKNLQILIEGRDLNFHHEGDWTISLLLDGQLTGQTGLDGAPIHAIAAAHDLAIENDLIEEPDHE